MIKNSDGSVHICKRDDRWIEYDGRGIELGYHCDVCHEEKIKGYNPVILRHYTQADVDERIEDDY